MSGRHAHGEEWAFTKYYSPNEVFIVRVHTRRDVVLLDGGSPDGSKNKGGTNRLGWILLPWRTLADRIAIRMLCDTVTMWAAGARRGAGAAGEDAEDQLDFGCRAGDGAREDVALWCITLRQYTASEQSSDTKAERKTYCTLQHGCRASGRWSS
jgi:hypothetical protein